MRWNIKKIKEYLKINNIEINLLSNKYKNNKQKLLWECECGNTFERAWNHVLEGSYLCSKCSRDNVVDKQKFKYEYVKKYIEDNSKCTLLSEEYKNIHNLLKLKCHCGNEFEISFNNFKQGKIQCNLCSIGVEDISKKENIFIQRKEYTKLIIKNYESKQYIFLIDSEDVDMVKKYQWSLDGRGYARACINGKYTKLHRFILNINNPDIFVDHINRDRKDTRKSNLRILDKKIYNTWNRSKSQVNTSGIIGVKNTNKLWEAYIMYYGKNICLGKYIKKEDAIKARLEGELKYFGQYAPQKNLFQKYNILNKITRTEVAM